MQEIKVMDEVSDTINRILRLEVLDQKDRAIIRAAFFSLQNDDDAINRLRDEFIRIHSGRI